jgi:hypothetical protein
MRRSESNFKNGDFAGEVFERPQRRSARRGHSFEVDSIVLQKKKQREARSSIRDEPMIPKEGISMRSPHSRKEKVSEIPVGFARFSFSPRKKRPTRRQSQRHDLSRFLQSQESRQFVPWLIFDVRQK